MLPSGEKMYPSPNGCNHSHFKFYHHTCPFVTNCAFADFAESLPIMNNEGKYLYLPSFEAII